MLNSLFLTLLFGLSSVAYAAVVVPSMSELDRINEQRRSMHFDTALQKLRLNRLKRGRGIKIAIIDGGVNSRHPYISSNLRSIAGRNIKTTGPVTVDGTGHGTHVAGIITQVAPEVDIVPIKVLDDSGFGSNEDVLKGIEYAISQNVQIISLSLGGKSVTEMDKIMFETLIKRAQDKNILLITAAGNQSENNDNSPIYPGNIRYDNVITVCSVDETMYMSSFSNYGKQTVHVCALGNNILSANNNFETENILFNYKSGTSMATPYVTGLAALILSNQPQLTPFQVRKRIMDSSSRYASLYSTTISSGVINADSALFTKVP